MISSGQDKDLCGRIRRKIRPSFLSQILISVLIPLTVLVAFVVYALSLQVPIGQKSAETMSTMDLARNIGPLMNYSGQESILALICNEFKDNKSCLDYQKAALVFDEKVFNRVEELMVDLYDVTEIRESDEYK